MQPWEAQYRIAVTDGLGHPLLQTQSAVTGPRACVPIAAAPVGSGYRVVSISTLLAGGAGTTQRDVTKTARIHLRWRASEARFVVVGLERDE